MLTAFGEKLLDYLFRGTAFTPPSTWYFGLDVSLTGDTYTEPAYTGYSRVGVSRATGSWATAVGVGQSVTAVDVTWPAVPTPYTLDEVVRRVFISDSATSSGETVFDYIDLADSVALQPLGQPSFAAGTLVLDAGE